MSEEREQIVLSSLCRYQKHREKYLEKVDKSDFSSTLSQEVLQGVVALVEMQSPITRESLQGYKSGDTIFSMMVAMLFDNKIPELDESVFTAFKEAGVRQRARLMGEYLVKNSRNTALPVATIVDNAKSMFDRIEGSTFLGMEEPEQACDSVIAKVESWAAGGSSVVWGIPEVDDKLFLNQLDGYVVIAAPPSVGKTACLAQTLKANAERGTASVWFSLEMSREDIYLRMVQNDEEMRGRYITKQNLANPEFMSTLKKCINKLKRLPLYIFDNIRYISHMRNIARKLSVTRDVKVAAVDYLQLALSDNLMDNDIVRVSKCSEVWKSLTVPDLAKGFRGLTAVALSQYSADGQRADNSSRGNDSKERIRSRLAGTTMRWSGQVRQDADLLLHLYTEDSVDDPAPLVTLFCDKYRKWRRGWEVPMTFQKDRQLFLTPQTIAENLNQRPDSRLQAARRVEI